MKRTQTACAIAAAIALCVAQIASAQTPTVVPVSTGSAPTKTIVPATMESGPDPSADGKLAFPTDPRRHIWFRHLQALPDDMRTAGLYVEFTGAPSATQNLTRLFEQAGYRVTSAGSAKYHLAIVGFFESDGKFKSKANLSDLLRNVALKDSSNANASMQSRTTDVATATILANQAVMRGLQSPIWASGDILTSFMNATGMTDSINKAITGDRRGMCLGPCSTYWNYTDQGVNFAWHDPRIKDRSKISVLNVGVYAEGVFPDELMSLAMNEFLRHHGIGQATEPNTPATMPMKEALGVIRNRIRPSVAVIEGK